MTDPLQIYFRAATPADVAFLERLRRITMYRSVTNHGVWNDELQRERVMANYDSARIICVGGQDIGLFKVVYSPTEVELDQIQLMPAWQKQGDSHKADYDAPARMRCGQSSYNVARPPLEPRISTL